MSLTANLAEDAVREKVTVLRADPEPGLEAQMANAASGRCWLHPRGVHSWVDPLSDLDGVPWASCRSTARPTRVTSAWICRAWAALRRARQYGLSSADPSNLPLQWVTGG